MWCSGDTKGQTGEITNAQVELQLYNHEAKVTSLNNKPCAGQAQCCSVKSLSIHLEGKRNNLSQENLKLQVI